MVNKKKKTRKYKRRKIKYRKMAFKFTDSQRKAIEHYCRIHKTTPVRFIKALVNKKVEPYRDSDYEPSYVTENQLTLFEIESSDGKGRD